MQRLQLAVGLQRDSYLAARCGPVGLDCKSLADGSLCGVGYFQMTSCDSVSGDTRYLCLLGGEGSQGADAPRGSDGLSIGTHRAVWRDGRTTTLAPPS